MGATAQNPDHAERRESPRRKASQWQTLWVSRWDGPQSGQWIGARLLDYTDKGIGIEVSAPLAVGARVVVKAPSGLSGSGGEAKFRGRVRWCQELAGGSHRAGILVEGRVGASGSSGERARQQAPPAEQQPPAGGDYYDLLQLSQQADPETVHRVYRMLAQRYHPDNQETGNEERFKQILEAYGVLSDPEKRAAYDARRRSHQRVQWKVFDQPKAAAGLEGEKRKRGGILSLLYTKRVNDSENPTATIHELEDLLGCPREHLQVSLWFLKEKGWITRSDNGRYAITVAGFEEAERTGVWPPQTNRLLEAPAAGPTL